MAARQPPDEDDFAAEPRSIDLHDYWLIVRRRWVLVLVTALLGAAAGAGYAFYRGPTYSATAQVLVAPVTQGPLNVPAQESTLVNMSTEQAVAQSAPVVRRAAGLLHTPLAVLQANVVNRLAVTVPITSDILQITWQAGSPGAAQAGANAFADAYLMYRHAYLAGQIGNLESVLGTQSAALQHKITHVSARMSRLPAGSPERQGLATTLGQLNDQLNTASSDLAALPTFDDTGGTVIASSLPLKPSSLGHAVILVLGGILGLLVGLVLAFARDVFDDRVRDAAQLERKLGAATLAVLPPAEKRRALPGDGRGDGPRRPGSAIATVAYPDSPAADAVRALRSTLAALAARRDLRTLLVVGADASVSSGRMAAELGVALAGSGRRVLLVAADMRGSALPQIFDLPNTAGLSDVLAGGGEAKAFTRQPKHVAGVTLPGAVLRRLAVLPSGPRVSSTLSVLDSVSMAELLRSQREVYDFVLLDSPPPVAADIYELATHVDGVLVVARAARTRGRTVADLRRGLDQVGAQLVGGVLMSKRPAGRRTDAGTGRPATGGLPAATADRQARARPPDRRPQPVGRALPERAATPPGSASMDWRTL